MLVYMIRDKYWDDLLLPFLWKYYSLQKYDMKILKQLCCSTGSCKGGNKDRGGHLYVVLLHVQFLRFGKNQPHVYHYMV